MRGGDQRRPRLVEADVPVHAEAEDLQIDSAGAGNRVFVTHALGLRIRRSPVQKIDAPGGDVDAIEQMPAHEGVVAARILRCDAPEFVEVERRRLTKIDEAFSVQSSEFSIEWDRCASRRQTEHESWIRGKRARNRTSQRSGRGSSVS